MSRSREQKLYVGCDNALELDGLKDYAGSYQNSAVVRCTALTRADNGEAVTGSFPYTMAYQASSNGRYIGVLPAALALVAGKRYVATVTISAAGLSDVRTLYALAENRGVV